MITLTVTPLPDLFVYVFTHSFWRTLTEWDTLTCAFRLSGRKIECHLPRNMYHIYPFIYYFIGGLTRYLDIHKQLNKIYSNTSS